MASQSYRNSSQWLVFSPLFCQSRPVHLDYKNDGSFGKEKWTGTGLPEKQQLVGLETSSNSYLGTVSTIAASYVISMCYLLSFLFQQLLLPRSLLHNDDI